MNLDFLRVFNNMDLYLLKIIATKIKIKFTNMILYNVTVNIEKESEEEWVAWMKQTHIPDVLATEMFLESKFYKILHDNEDGTTNYSVQYFTDSMEKIYEYQQNFAKKLQEDVKMKFQDRFVVFRTLLETVE
jgi:hypothetical protein